MRPSDTGRCPENWTFRFGTWTKSGWHSSPNTSRTWKPQRQGAKPSVRKVSRSLRPRGSGNSNHISIPNAVAALYVRGLGVIYPPEWTFALTENAVQNGAELFLNTAVTGISSEEGCRVIHTDGKDLKTRFIINAAGLFADEIARMVGDDDIRLILTKGVMAIFDRSTEPAIRHMSTARFPRNTARP